MAWLKSAQRRIAKFARLGLREQWLAIRIVGMLWRVRIALWVLPFQRVRAMATRMGRAGVGKNASGISAHNLTSLISVAAVHVPGASCLTQALVAQALLERYGYEPVLKIGVGRTGPDNRFGAHAWIELEGKVVIGQVTMLDQYTQLPTLAAVTPEK
ncbi:MAG TPA: lasso peptide biosynthesis B2 protein [Tepidisphaeraceae bacterium]|jgi:hypothetical protein